ncbi:MAG: hypothetical protein M1828_003448 [Chrysothrix sp. TS-e1954]|nr:MAG: hypothetical protein M1828_003448 [Chrysothrix sp. TS-e1954]
MELCSAVHGLSRNVGCQCTEPGGPVECSEATGGDPRLMRAISSVPPARPKTFEVFCQDRCICEDEDSSSAQEEFESEDSDELQFSNNDPLPPNVVVPGARTPLTAEQLWDRFSALGVGVGGPDRFNPRCNATCNVNSDCKPEYASRLTSEDCRCKVLSETVVPATHAVQYSAACQLSFANKRGEPVPCPCNTTYVSHACCESFEGRVWETPELKLGELKRTLEDL